MSPYGNAGTRIAIGRRAADVVRCIGNRMLGRSSDKYAGISRRSHRGNGFDLCLVSPIER